MKGKSTDSYVFFFYLNANEERPEGYCYGMCLKTISILFSFLIFLNFEVFSKSTEEKYLVIQLSHEVELSESGENYNFKTWSGSDEPLYATSANEFTRKFLITEGFNIINHHDNKLEFKYSDLSIKYPLTAIKSIGFLFENNAPASVNDIGVLPLENKWKIYNLEGTLIGSGERGEPPFSLLERGKIYIIVINNKTYKYQRWK